MIMHDIINMIMYNVYCYCRHHSYNHGIISI